MSKTFSDHGYTITLLNSNDYHTLDNAFIEDASKMEALAGDGELHTVQLKREGYNYVFVVDGVVTENAADLYGFSTYEESDEYVGTTNPTPHVSSYDTFTIKKEGVTNMPDNTTVNTYALEWDKPGEHYYENGVSHGVLYPQKSDGTYDEGVAWSGLTNVTKSPEGAEPNDLWADNIKYASLRSAETFSGNIEAYTYPPEYRKCIGLAEAATGVYFGQQAHEPFGFCFRTEIGNDTPSEGDDAFKIHIVYGATASPSEESYDTINDSPDATPFSWDFDTLPVVVPGFKPVSCIVVDSRYTDAAKMTTLLEALYGKGATKARLPLPAEIKTMMS